MVDGIRRLFTVRSVTPCPLLLVQRDGDLPCDLALLSRRECRSGTSVRPTQRRIDEKRHDLDGLEQIRQGLQSAGLGF